MKRQFLGKTLVFAFLLTLALGGIASSRAADNYAIDTFHSGVTFRIAHLGLTWVHGRFNEFAGNFTIDKDDPSKSTFALTIKSDSVDTAIKKRDDHLRGPDFFDVKQYPEIIFKSTAVKALDNGYEVTGEFSMHGKVKPITFKLLGGKTAEFPKGVQRIGFYADIKIKRSDFGVGEEKFAKALGDDIFIAVGLEGTKK